MENISSAENVYLRKINVFFDRMYLFLLVKNVYFDIAEFLFESVDWKAGYTVADLL